MGMHRPLTGIRHPGHGETDTDGQMVCEHQRGNRAGRCFSAPIGRASRH
jgi:hypothetical protein